MSNHHPFDEININMVTSYGKQLGRRAVDQFDEDMLYLAKKAPNVTKQYSEMVYDKLDEIKIDLAKTHKVFVAKREEYAEKLNTLDTPLLSYDESVREAFTFRIHTSFSKAFLQLVIDMERLIPYIETMAYRKVFTEKEQNQLKIAFRNQLFDLGKRITKIKIETENSLQGTILKRRKPRIIKPIRNNKQTIAINLSSPEMAVK